LTRIANSLLLHQRGSPYRPLRPSVIFRPNVSNPEPFIGDLARRIDLWRKRPKRQIRNQILRALLGSDYEPTTNAIDIPSNGRSSKNLSDILSDVYESHKAGSDLGNIKASIVNAMGDIYQSHLETFDKEDEIQRHRTEQEDYYLLRKRGQNTPRDPNWKLYPPLTMGTTVDCVNDTWYALEHLPVVPSNGKKVVPFKHAALPGKCPYPDLPKYGFVQPYIGARLRTLSPPQPITSFKSSYEFERYIYSLAFHRERSHRIMQMIMNAFLSRDNTPFLTPKAFRYAISAFLIDRPSDVYSARRLVDRMISACIPMDIYLYNAFLRAAVFTESLRAFAEILREMVSNTDVKSDHTTWSIILEMGMKLESVNWVTSILDIMNARGIALDQIGLGIVFRVTVDLINCDELKTMYLQHYSNEPFVSWQALNIVLETLCLNKRLNEAFELLIKESEKDKPKVATLHIFIRMCEKFNLYDRVWEIIGEFRKRWDISPQQMGIRDLFNFAFDSHQISDAILIWEFASSQNVLWSIHRSMILKGRAFEREYGMKLPENPRSLSELENDWKNITLGNRNPDRFHRVPHRYRTHVQWMDARKLSQELVGKEDVPEQVRLWRTIEKAYDSVVASGQWTPWPPPKRMDIQRPASPRDQPSRLTSGWNYIVRERLVVWKMIEQGAIKWDKESL
jgi:hypothetical protein